MDIVNTPAGTVIVTNATELRALLQMCILRDKEQINIHFNNEGQPEGVDFPLIGERMN
jgi:hypothetical protein